MDAAKLGSLVTSAELKALFEGGLHETTRYFLRATLKPDPHRTLTDSVSAASAMAQAISTQNKVPGVAPNSPRLLRPTRRVLWAADIEDTEPALEDLTDMIDWDAQEFDPAGQTMACYGAPQAKRPYRAEGSSARLCWTCWLPGHFSEECPVIPEHLREEISARKRTALMDLRKQRSGGTNTRPGWYKNNSKPTPDLPSSPDSETDPAGSTTTPDAKPLLNVQKKRKGGAPSPSSLTLCGEGAAQADRT